MFHVKKSTTNFDIYPAPKMKTNFVQRHNYTNVQLFKMKIHPILSLIFVEL
jgi:hypothetical protein